MKHSGPSPLTLLTLSIAVSFYLGTSHSILFGSESAESCQLAAESLKADLERTPNNALPIFGEAVKISPNCLRGLFQTAIRTSRPDEGLLQQMIRIALNHYPEESNSIAEVCMEEAPDKAGAIKAAFVSVPKLKKESKSNRDWSAPVSPIDRFLNKVQKMPVEPTKESNKDEEADKEIMKAMEKMAAKVREDSGTIPTPQVSMPNALAEEKSLAGQLSEKAEREIIFTQSDKINVTPDVETESLIKLKTLDNTESLRTDLGGPDFTAPVIMLDNESEMSVEDEEEKEKPLPEVKQPSLLLKKAYTPRSLRLLNTPSTVYYIPPPARVDSTSQGPTKSPNHRNHITLRSNPISPTSPR